MRSEAKELRRLEHLLKMQRLSPSERAAIEQQIKDLEQSQSRKTIPLTPGVFGVFDRPKPDRSDPEPVRTEASTSELPAKPSEPDADTNLHEGMPDLSPEEFEAL